MAAIPQDLLNLSDEEVQSRLNELKATMGAVTQVARERGIITTKSSNPGGTHGKVLSAARQLALARFRFEREQRAVTEAEQALQVARDTHTQGGGTVDEAELTEVGNTAVSNWQAATEKIRQKTRDNAAAKKAAAVPSTPAPEEPAPEGLNRRNRANG